MTHRLKRGLAVLRRVSRTTHGDHGTVAALGGREVVSQAQGMLMLVYGIDEATARDLLTVISQTHDVDLRLLVHRITQDLGRPGQLTSDVRARLHRRVLTAHEGS